MQGRGQNGKADIEKVTIRTHEACLRIIKQKLLNKPGGPRSRIQYMVAACCCSTANRGGL